MQTQLQYRYEWYLTTTPALVWQVLNHLEAWPEWWTSVSEVKQISVGNARGEGKVMRSVWKGWLANTVKVEMRILVAEENLLLVTKSSGELQGLGLWEIRGIPVGVAVRYTGKVSLTPFLHWFYPIIKPMMNLHFQHIMRAGAEGMACKLGVELIDCVEVSHEFV